MALGLQQSLRTAHSLGRSAAVPPRAQWHQQPPTWQGKVSMTTLTTSARVGSRGLLSSAFWGAASSDA